MSEKVTEFAIDRARWLRGTGSAGSFLFHPEQKKCCCVGIYIEACGLKMPQMEWMEAAHSSYMRQSIPDQARWLLRIKDGVFQEHNPASDAAQILYEENDTMEISGEKERERAIRSVFAEQGIRVRFKGKG